MLGLDWTAIIIAALAGGLIAFIRDAVRGVRAWLDGKTPKARQAMTITTVDQSLTVVARARDELEADNVRLREMIDERDRRYDEEMRRRDAREAAYREEIDKLEAKVREILSELENLKTMHP